MNNMKIRVENNLDEIVGELERLNCKCGNPYFFDVKNLRHGVINTILAYSSGVFYFHKTKSLDVFFECSLTTLAELKEM